MKSIGMRALSPKIIAGLVISLMIALSLSSLTALAEDDSAIFTVTTTADSGSGSLRQAILDANSSVSSNNIIVFNIAGGGVQTISPVSALPLITTPQTIDGTRQPGYAGSPLIELNGTNAAGSLGGLVVMSNNSLIKGLTINRFKDGAAIIFGGDYNTVQSSYLGTFADGNSAPATNNNKYGVDVQSNIGYNRIGGTNPTLRNILSGNSSAGVSIRLGTNVANGIYGNYIGMGANGTTPVPNLGNGIEFVAGGGGNAIGNSDPASGNLIANNGRNGVFVRYGGVNSVFYYNTITNNAQNGLDLETEGQVWQDVVANIITNNKANGVFIGTNNGNTTFGKAGFLPNVVANNLGAGFLIQSGTGNELFSNSIFNNGGLGIDIGGTGLVNPNLVLNPSPGPNNFQNFPLLDAAANNGSGFLVTGFLKSAANTNFRIDFFGTATCSAGFGQGQTPLGSTQVTTDGTGATTFNATVPGNDGVQFITSTATNLSTHDTSEFSACIALSPALINLNNQFWQTAYALNLANVDPTSPTVTQANISQQLTKKYQSAWFKFTIKPGARLSINLTNLPANYDLTLYKDIGAVFNSSLANNADLTKQSAEFAPDFISPDFISPDFISPDFISPDFISSAQNVPDFISPDFISPDFISPDFISPDFISPDFISPDFISPDFISSYTNAQRRSLLTYSAREGSADELITQNTWDNSGTYYVRVRGRNGEFSPVIPFKLSVTLSAGVCGNVAPGNLASSLPTPSTGTKTTLVLTDLGRMSGDTSALTAALNTFIARPEVNGVVVNVGDDAKVAALNAQADNSNYVACPYAKNLVAYSIKDIVDKYRTANPSLQYIVIIGSDNVIPFFRHPEQVDLGQEKTYEPPVKDNTTSKATLQLNYVLGQDRYGAATELASLDRSFPIPGLAVGRLVETPSDVTGMLNAYLKTQGGVVATPTSSLVTGYDFLTSGSIEVKNQLDAGIGTTGDSLIANQNLGPASPVCPNGFSPTGNCVWTAQDLKDTLFGIRHDLVYLAGHFSQASALAADYTSRITTQDFLASGINFENSIIFSTGCHSGYNTVDGDSVAGITPTPDWAQAAAIKHATLIAGTAYQYGDNEKVAYGPKLYAEFSKQLRSGTGAVSIGKALVNAKNSYLAGTPKLSGIDDKTLLEVTLYGLPMLSVNMPGTRITPTVAADDSAKITSTTPLAATGLTVGTLNVNPSLTSKNVALTGAGGAASTTATYLTGADGNLIKSGEPFLPLELRNVKVNGTVLRGVGFFGGTYTDSAPNITPLMSTPSNELRGVRRNFKSNVFFPRKTWNVNYFSALQDTVNGITRLAITPAQYVSSPPDSTTTVLRSYSNLNFRLYYSNNPAPEVAQLGAPTIASVQALVDGSNNINFTVNITGAKTQEAWITYTSVNPGDGNYGKWQSFFLTGPTTNWTGTLAGVSNVSDLRFMVQAAGPGGLVSLDDNAGKYYSAPVVTGAIVSKPNTMLSFVNPPTSGSYGSTASFTVKLMGADGTFPSGKTVNFSLGLRSAKATTDANGVATATFDLTQLSPQQYNLSASFAETTDYKASAAFTSFTITPLATQLTLTPQPAGQYGNQNPFIATLKDAANRPILNKTVYFSISGAGGSYTTSGITDYLGRAPIGAFRLPTGSYSVTAKFLGAISGNLSATSSIYTSSSVTTTFAPTKTNQFITFDLSGYNKTTSDSPFTVTATGGGSGNPITFTSKSLSVCTVTAAGSVTALKAGNCTLVAAQAGNASYFDALPVQNTLYIGQGSILPFPGNGVLDDFNRANGGLGANWIGNTDMGFYAISNNSVKVGNSGYLYWNNQFGPNQEVFYTFGAIGPKVTEADLLLKASGGNLVDYGGWTLEVHYNNKLKQVTVETLAPPQNWIVRATFPNIAFVSGDQFGARATADGSVKVYKNGLLIGTTNVTTGPKPWAYAASGGYIGVWFIGPSFFQAANETRFDNFGGGNS